MPAGGSTVEGIEPRRLRSRDGTRLAYYAGGAEEGVALVFCGGLGGGIRVWQPLIERFARRFRLLAWDYRGLYASGPSRRRAYGIEHHARDLRQLLDHEGIEAPVLLGWSMGVQVMLEAHRDDPELARGLVAVHGTSGRPLQTAFGSDVMERILPPLSLVMRGAGRRLASAAPGLARSRLVAGSFVWASQRLGWMAPAIDLERFQDVAAEWLGLDLGVYAEIFQRMGEHDASDLLAAIRAPALVIAGGRDRFTPSSTARAMAAAMPAAQLELLPDATHFGLIEYPDQIASAVERFLSERIRIPAPAPDQDRLRRAGAREPRPTPLQGGHDAAAHEVAPKALDPSASRARRAPLESPSGTRSGGSGVWTPPVLHASPALDATPRRE
jgi:pimeloyl-ACP methyl ester carboxylesterase